MRGINEKLLGQNRQNGVRTIYAHGLLLRRVGVVVVIAQGSSAVQDVLDKPLYNYSAYAYFQQGQLEHSEEVDKVLVHILI